jgi:DNA-binding transcriptional LysR family regulator
MHKGCLLTCTARRYHTSVTPELRQLRYFVAVAERGSFTGAAQELFVAQQAISQQVKALETALGVTLLWRTSRRVELTPAGKVFLADCRRVLAATDRAVRRVQEAARGEVGTVRICYTVTAAYQTVPELLARLGQHYPQLKTKAREVFADDLPRLLHSDRCDVGIAPATRYPVGLHQQQIRAEPWRLAVGEKHPMADRAQIPLAELGDEQVELWPRDMAPGYYDAVVSACQAAGFEPRLDQEAAGSTVWGYIAQGRGIGLVVSSLAEQLPLGVRLIDIAPPAPPPLAITAVWQPDEMQAAVERLLEVAAELAAERGWT